MSNIKRHFNFGLPKYLPIQGKSLPGLESRDNVPRKNFTKPGLINEISSCLELCSSYIQALNSLCSAGTILARSLHNIVRDAPLFRDIAGQFLNIWEDIGIAAGGASAAVKTETLMILQEALTKLEEDINNESYLLADSIQVVGSCLLSYVELQAQFSLLSWKSLSKLVKNFSNEGFLNSFSLDHKSGEINNKHKVMRNSDLSSTIKKHFTHLLHKLGGSKSNESLELSYSQFYLGQTGLPQCDNQNFENYREFLPHSTENSESLSSWTSGVMTWPSNDSHLLSTSNHTQSLPASKSAASTNMAQRINELQDVINLLSCTPADQVPSLDSSLFPIDLAFVEEESEDEQSWSQATINTESSDQSFSNTTQEQFTGKGTWPGMGRGVVFGLDSWIWGNSNFDSNSSIAKNAEHFSVRRSEDPACKSLHNDSTRRHSISDGWLDSPRSDIFLPSSEESVHWDTRVVTERDQKTSTWPLKQTGSRDREACFGDSSCIFQNNTNWSLNSAILNQKERIENKPNQYLLFGHPS